MVFTRNYYQLLALYFFFGEVISNLCVLGSCEYNILHIKSIHQQMHLLLSFKIYITNHFDLLLHVSVYNHHQGAFTGAQLKLYLG